MQATIENVRRQLEANSDEKTRKNGKRFFKEAVHMYGMKTTVVTSIAKHAFTEIKALPKEEIFAMCEELWRSGYMEEGFIACA